MFQPSATASILPIFNQSITQDPKPTSYSWQKWAKAGLVFAITTGAFLALRATGSLSLITAWLKNNPSETDGLTGNKVIEVRDDLLAQDKIGALDASLHKQTVQYDAGLVTSEQNTPESLGFTDFKEFPLTIAQQRTKRNLIETPTKMGTEFQVNTYTTSDQRYPSVAGLSNGKFVVTWQSYGQDSSYDGIFGQLFEADSTRYLQEFQINEYILGNQKGPFTKEIGNQEFVVAWASYAQNGRISSIVQKIYHNNGTEYSGEIMVENISTLDPQALPVIGSLTDNKFVIAWVSWDKAISNDGIYAKIFYQNGTEYDRHFQVSGTTINNWRPSVSGRENFGIVWQGCNPHNNNSYITYGQIFNNDSSRYGNIFELVNNNYSYPDPIIEYLDAKKFMIAWIDQDDFGGGVFFQIYHTNGTILYNKVLANSQVFDWQYEHSIASLNNDEFVVVWNSWGQDGDQEGIFGQLFQANGTKYGQEFQINTYTDSTQQHPHVARLNDTNFVVVWESDGQDGDGYGIYGQIFSYNFTISGSLSIPDGESISGSNNDEPFPQSESDKKSEGNISTIVGSIVGALAGTVCITSIVIGGIYFWRRNHQGIFLDAILLGETSNLPFRIIREIGHGGYAMVYEGKYIQKEKEIDVAIKKLHRTYVESDGLESIKEEFAKEAVFLQQYKHPNLIEIVDFIPDPHWCIVLKYYHRGSLANVLRDQKYPLPWNPERNSFMAGIAQGLKFLHANNIIHRDMKPDNVLIDEDMRPKITDFGTARIQDTLTQTKGIGTPTYLAPEVVKPITGDGKVHYDSAVDVYAFSLILWAIWKREEPFQEFENAWQMMAYVVDEQGRPPLEGCPSQSLASLMSRCWAHRADIRPKMPQVCDELNTVTAELAVA